MVIVLNAYIAIFAVVDPFWREYFAHIAVTIISIVDTSFWVSSFNRGRKWQGC